MRRESLVLPAHEVLALELKALWFKLIGHEEQLWHIEHQLSLNRMYIEMRRKAVVTKRACPWLGEEPNTFVRPALSSF